MKREELIKFAGPRYKILVQVFHYKRRLAWAPKSANETIPLLGKFEIEEVRVAPPARQRSEVNLLGHHRQHAHAFLPRQPLFLARGSRSQRAWGHHHH